MTKIRTLICAAVVAAAVPLAGCSTVAKTTGKAVALPFKGAYHGTKAVGKGAYYGTKAVGKGVYGTTKFVGKSVIATGKGVYYVGMVPVKITDKALDTTAKVLSVTTQAVDLTGKVVVTTRHIQAARLDAELAGLRSAKNVMGVIVDVVS